MHYRTGNNPPKFRTYIGSGILVNYSHVLTAAHCLYDKEFAFPELVQFLPGTSKSLTPEVAYAKRLIVHPAYYKDTSSRNADIGMFLLNKPLGDSLGYHPVAPLDKEHFPLFCKVAGYPGDRDSGKNMYYSSGRTEIHPNDDSR